MANLQDIIQLSKKDGGKFYVLDNDGEVRLVIVPVEEYQRLVDQKPRSQTIPTAEDVEKVNREILKAQLTEPDSVPSAPLYPIKRTPAPHQPHVFQDLREEVIDPTFDFEGPKMDIDEI